MSKKLRFKFRVVLTLSFWPKVPKVNKDSTDCIFLTLETLQFSHVRNFQNTLYVLDPAILPYNAHCSAFLSYRQHFFLFYSHS